MSTLAYNRWNPIEKKSWPYRCLRYYYDEVNRLMMAHKAALKFSCTQLQKIGAKDESIASDYLHTSKNNNRLTIKQWHKSYSNFDNWTYLNAIIALSSAFETYLSCIIRMAIDSDPGLIINNPKSIDGVAQKKNGTPYNSDFIEDTLVSCTKGDWTTRIKAMQKLFGSIPTSFSDNIAQLEELRTLRNNVAHAFGRNIDKAKDYRRFDIDPMKKVTYDQFRKYQSLILTCSRQLDEQLMSEHIGMYPILLFYHDNRNKLIKHPIETRFDYFKTLIGKESQKAISKDLSKWIINYYENL